LRIRKQRNPKNSDENARANRNTDNSVQDQSAQTLKFQTGGCLSSSHFRQRSFDTESMFEQTTGEEDASALVSFVANGKNKSNIRMRTEDIHKRFKVDIVLRASPVESEGCCHVAMQSSHLVVLEPLAYIVCTTTIGKVHFVSSMRKAFDTFPCSE
jgi:hypothetical protein